MVNEYSVTILFSPYFIFYFKLIHYFVGTGPLEISRYPVNQSKPVKNVVRMNTAVQVAWQDAVRQKSEKKTGGNVEEKMDGWMTIHFFLDSTHDRVLIFRTSFTVYHHPMTKSRKTKVSYHIYYSFTFHRFEFCIGDLWISFTPAINTFNDRNLGWIHMVRLSMRSYTSV